MPITNSQRTELSTTSSHAPIVPQDVPKASGDGEDGGTASAVFSPAKLLHALRRKWLVSLPLAAIISVAVYWVADSRLSPIFTVRTLVQVGPVRPVILYDNLGGGIDSVNHQRTQIATIKSRSVRQSVVRDLEPLDLATFRTMQDPVGWLEKEIQADYSVAPEILRVTMKGSVPDELLLILNAVRDRYLHEVLNKDHSERKVRLQNLTELSNRHDSALKILRQKMICRADSIGGRDLPSLRVKYEYWTSQIHTLQTELSVFQSENHQESVAVPEPREVLIPDPVLIESLLNQAMVTDAVAEGLRKEIVRLEKKLADFELRLLNFQNDSEYKKSTIDLATARTALTRRRELLRPALTNQTLSADRLQKPRETGGNNQNTVSSKHKQTHLEAEIQRKEREVTELAKGIAELELLRGDIVQQEERLNLVNSKIQAIEVELQAPERAKVLEEAVIVETPKLDRAIKYTVAPAAGAFFAVIFFIAWLDLLRGRVNGSAELEAARIPVIGKIPSVKLNVLPLFAPPDHDRVRREYLRLTDAIEMARAVIAPILASTPGYTLVVTSAAAGEGKTVLAGHLAARLARSGLRTLLIDTDIRRPQIHRLFGLRSRPGFGEWLSGQLSLSDVVSNGPIPRLEVITAGECDFRAVAELFDLRFPELLQEMRLEYDVIILDTAPLLSTPESLALSRKADGVLLSVMRDVSRLPGVLACAERLVSINAHVLGAVITGDAPAKYDSY